MLPKKVGTFIAYVFRKIFDFRKGHSIPPILQVSMSAPVTVSVEAAFCTEKCQDSGRNVEAIYHGSLPKVTGDLSLNLGLFERSWSLFSINVYERSLSRCLLSLVKVPCCIVDNLKPGKIDPETQECEEECDCDPDDSTRPKGVKIKDGSCRCDKCPDGSLKLKRSSGKPTCPCLCADGTEREMSADKSCPCSCECPDGSKVTISSDGSCPCECFCKDGRRSNIVPLGCECEDKCPVCGNGEEPIWIDKKCLCREINDCGVPPVCVRGRKGPKCNQPDCESCEGCSRNGVCVTSSSCGSWCRCNARWEGQCCERRRPIRRWGDPHLETLDGVEFDYFGIGEFWDCKSVKNDFGMQTRFFAYRGASLTGAVAIKVGHSVVTITTSSQSLPGDLPTLRVDGSRYNLSTGERFTFANETVSLNVFKPGNDSGSDNTLVIILAFQYKSGVTVSVEAAYSPIMKRQFLNIKFTPIASFTRETEGICGFMDDDPSNDLLGPTGIKYLDPLEFAESWRVNTSHPRSGTFSSWSWNSSNFHQDDVMDLSYVDKNHKPIYSLDNFSQDQVDKARSICENKGLEGNFLSNCIFDISVTNDTSFSEQQSLQLGCLNDCTGKGLCHNTSCTCLEGWSGEDCSIGSCGNCSRGNCVDGFCQCQIGWEGPACDKEATCFGVDNCTSDVHGKCQTTDRCLCNPGYTGMNCGVKTTCYNVLNCSQNGKCIDIDVCQCDIGWKSSTCREFSCESLGYCSGNGRCIAFDVCECSNGWTGASCSIPDCSVVSHCSRNGECVAPNSCRCFDGFQGKNCNASLNCSHLGDCSGNGICLLNNELINTCSCFTGFTGSTCSVYDCSGVDDCSGNGNCTEPNLCSCYEGYEGLKCLNFSCETLNRCSGHGTCVGFDQCKCHNGWMGISCDVANCIDLGNCSSNGICVFPNQCQCYDQYDGENCTENVQPNLNAPVFANKTYTATVSERRSRGYYVLTIFANDSDPGRGGSVSYGIVEPSIASYFILDKNTGRIIIAGDGVLDYEKLGQTYFLFTVTATDEGTPERSSEATVNITVVDENDNCPVFQTSPGNYKLPLTIIALDDDSNENGLVEYDVDDDSDPDSNFHINQRSGELLPKKMLEPGAYPLTIVARDLGDPPCFRELLLTINVDETLFPSSVSALPNATTARASDSTGVVQRSETELKYSTSPTTHLQPDKSTTVPAMSYSSSPSQGMLPLTAHTSMASTLVVSTKNISSSQTPQLRNVTSSSFATASNDVSETASTRGQVTSSVTVPSINYSTSSSQDILSSSAHSSMVSTMVISAYNTPSSQPAQLRDVTTTSFVTVSSEVSKTTLIKITIRVTNKDFTTSLEDETSEDYRQLRVELQNVLLLIFMKMEGFLRITSVTFKQGSVIADVQVAFASKTKVASSETIIRAIINASDSEGNIGDLNFDIPYMERSFDNTTNGEDSDGDDSSIFIVPIAAPAGAITMIVLIAICLFFYLKKKDTERKRRVEERMEMDSFRNRYFEE